MPEHTKKQKKENVKSIKGAKRSTESKSKRSSSKSSRSTKEKKEVRYFKLIDTKSGKTNGRYTGDTPKQAASKAYTKMVQKCKKDKKPLPRKSDIYLRESTRGSLKKIYGYVAKRDQLEEPQQLVIPANNDNPEKTITYHFRNKIRKIKVPEKVTEVVANRKKASASAKGGSKSSKTKNSKSKSASKSAPKSAPKSASKTKSAKSSK